MTEAPLDTLVALAIILGALAGVWWRWHSHVQRVKDDLAAHKLHVSETYATKQGQREQTETMLTAVNGVRSDIKSLNDRIDRLFENPPKRTRSTS